jgi:DNA-binding protein
MANDLPIAAVVRIAKNNGAERVGSDAAQAIADAAQEYIAELTREASKYAVDTRHKFI